MSDDERVRSPGYMVSHDMKTNQLVVLRTMHQSQIDLTNKRMRHILLVVNDTNALNTIGSFTHDLTQYVTRHYTDDQIQIACSEDDEVTFREDVTRILPHCTHVLLSGSRYNILSDGRYAGPTTMRDNVHWLLRHVDIHTSLMGICFGCQALNNFFGGRICRSRYPYTPSDGLHSVKLLAHTMWSPKHTHTIDVMEYHFHEIQSLGTNLIITGIGCRQVSAVAARDRPWYGVQFHLMKSAHGLDILEHFLMVNGTHNPRHGKRS